MEYVASALKRRNGNFHSVQTFIQFIKDTNEVQAACITNIEHNAEDGNILSLAMVFMLFLIRIGSGIRAILAILVMVTT